MSEKRFTLEQWTEESLYFSDGEYSAHMSIEYICKKVEKKLNEQQTTIQSLKSDKAIAEDYANIFEKENVKLRKQIGEQQATITHLEKVNGKNFAKRRLLEQDNLVLQNENEQLRERLYDFEKRKIIEESDIDEDVIPKVKLLRTELFGEKYE